ncbi:hypothetical protein PAXRUDRAFT_36553 [Paxillus rubicundulus Ve08.2h10]|uniref:Uncharacterized protein n=1 Tax=Paxillus rubicundulus Ve08.2h10 TaxID=930991 RepID=A0A0D0C789_9AGAM|nr:hypothetical protein PAXRUDRAFT_36553 [Paxillus rubicundulus Ve08.2h10]
MNIIIISGSIQLTHYVAGEHANYDGSEPDQPESQYHDGFTPLPPRSSNGEKRHKNAKITSINRIMYFHEDSLLAQLLDAAIETLDQHLHPNNFTAKYTILCTAYKDIDITSIKNFDVLITEVQKQRSPAFKLLVTQTKTSKPNNEETKLNEHITELSQLYTCEDRSCKFPICWPSPTDAKHVHLMPLHLKTWAATIV